MPWSPIPKFPEIIQNLKMKGFTKEVPLIELRKEIMLKTGAIKDQTIKQTMLAMETLDFVKNLNNGFFLLEPKKWEKELEKKQKEQEKKREKEIEKELKNKHGGG